MTQTEPSRATTLANLGWMVRALGADLRAAALRGDLPRAEQLAAELPALVQSAIRPSDPVARVAEGCDVLIDRDNAFTIRMPDGSSEHVKTELNDETYTNAAAALIISERLGISEEVALAMVRAAVPSS